MYMNILAEPTRWTVVNVYPYIVPVGGGGGGGHGQEKMAAHRELASEVMSVSMPNRKET